MSGKERAAYVGLALTPRFPAAADSRLRDPDVHCVFAQRFDRLRLEEMVDLSKIPQSSAEV